MSDRSTFLLLSDFERLEDWCRMVRVIFNSTPYLVGSATERADYRDVDVRVVLDVDAFAALSRGRLDSIRFLNRALSVWGRAETGLPIDFQVQCGTETEAFPTPRHAMGVRDWSAIPTSGVPAPDPIAPYQLDEDPEDAISAIEANGQAKDAARRRE